jgi:hypothetical protein
MLTETCTIERETGVKGSMGEPLHTWETVQSGVACRLITAGTRNTGDAEIVGGQESLVERYRLITPVLTPFTLNDRVIMADGRVFQVVAVEDGLTDEAYASCVVTRMRA